MTDTTQPRRDLLSALLDRAEDGTLTPAEGALLRPLVAAEQDAAPGQVDHDARVRAAALREGAAALQAVVDRDKARFPHARGQSRIALGGAREILLGLIDQPAPADTDAAPTCTAQYHGDGWTWHCALDGGQPGPSRMTVDEATHVLAEDIARRAVEGDGTGQMLGVIAQVAEPPTGDRLARVTAALTAEHYRRAKDRIVASPEEHSAAMAKVALAALDGEQPAESAPDGAGQLTEDVAVYPSTDAPSEQQ